MTHPDLAALAFGPDAVEQRAIIDDLDGSAAEFAVAGRPYLATRLFAQHLFAIADAEDRHVGGEDVVGNARRAGFGDRRRATRQDHRLRAEAIKGFATFGEGDDFGIDPGLADAARDQLRHLAAEIEDEDGAVGVRHRRGLITRGPAVQ